MQVSRRSDYALRMLLVLAAEPTRNHRVSDIAVALEVSENHLAKVAQVLSRSGFIESKRGRGGGLRLRRPSADIRIGDVLRATGPTTPLVECHDVGASRCVLTGACRLTAAFAEAHEAFLATLDKVTLADSLTKPALRRLHRLRTGEASER